jgi:hypothetical protein
MPLIQLLDPDFKPKKSSWRSPDVQKAVRNTIGDIIDHSMFVDDENSFVAVLHSGLLN